MIHQDKGNEFFVMRLLDARLGNGPYLHQSLTYLVDQVWEFIGDYESVMEAAIPELQAEDDCFSDCLNSLNSQACLLFEAITLVLNHARLASDRKENNQ